jgi:hypothetical protein
MILRPGEYRVDCIVGLAPAAMRYLTVEAGKGYYLQEQVGWAGSIALTPVDEATGRAAVSTFTLNKGAISGNDVAPSLWPFDSGMGYTKW